MEKPEDRVGLLRGEEGAAAPEYSVMIALVILVVLLTVLFLGQVVTNLFDKFGSMVAPYFGQG